MKISNPKDKAVTLSVLAVTVLAFMIFKLPCPINLILKLPCPGCGMTRAYLSLLHFDFITALNQHPMFWSVPVLLIYYLFDYRLFKNKFINDGILYLIGAGFLINWIVKIF